MFACWLPSLLNAHYSFRLLLYSRCRSATDCINVIEWGYVDPELNTPRDRLAFQLDGTAVRNRLDSWIKSFRTSRRDEYCRRRWRHWAIQKSPQLWLLPDKAASTHSSEIITQRGLCVLAYNPNFDEKFPRFEMEPYEIIGIASTKIVALYFFYFCLWFYYTQYFLFFQ